MARAVERAHGPAAERAQHLAARARRAQLRGAAREPRAKRSLDVGCDGSEGMIQRRPALDARREQVERVGQRARKLGLGPRAGHDGSGGARPWGAEAPKARALRHRR